MMKYSTMFSVSAALAVFMLMSMAVGSANAQTPPPFDPASVPVGSVHEDLNKENGGGLAMTATIWLHGYAAGVLGVDVMGPMSSQALKAALAFFVYEAAETPEKSILEVAADYVEAQNTIAGRDELSRIENEDGE